MLIAVECKLCLFESLFSLESQAIHEIFRLDILMEKGTFEMLSEFQSKSLWVNCKGLRENFAW